MCCGAVAMLPRAAAVLAVLLAVLLACAAAEEGEETGETRAPIYTTYSPYLVFEGVDYDLLPPPDRYHYTEDCFAQYLNCVRHRTFVNPVCALSNYYNRIHHFNDICNLQLENCEFKLLNWTEPSADYFFYNGEGKDCSFYRRQLLSGAEVAQWYLNGEQYALWRRLRTAATDEQRRLILDLLP